MRSINEIILDYEATETLGEGTDSTQDEFSFEPFYNVPGGCTGGGGGSSSIDERPSK